MRKYLLYALLFVICSVSAQVPTRYFIEEKEISESFYNNLPDSIISKCILMTLDYDTLIVKKIDLPYTHYLDTVSVSGGVSIKEHSPEKKATLRTLLAKFIQKDLKVNVGDKFEDSLSLLNILNDTVTVNLSDSGKCYLISFWATWCGNCLIELQPDNIPKWIEEFKANAGFEFIPVCIDTTPDELKQFFESENEKNWKYLFDLTLIDIDRHSNSLFAKSGILPLNIVIGKEGVVRYIKIGGINGEPQINELKDAISTGLRCQARQ